MRPLASLYSYRFPVAIVFMLQSSEYQSVPYLKWLWRTRDFSTVQRRRQLERTRYANLLLTGLFVAMLLQILAGLALIIFGLISNIVALWSLGLALILSYPIVWSHLIIVPLELGRRYIVSPSQQKDISRSVAIFEKHPGIKIAVAGSYGKTSMKEVLATVIAAGKKVAATEANYNVATEHAKFAQKLSGSEDVLIIEYGEGAPGDVERFASITQPTHGIITGIAPAHLDRYKTLDAAAQDIFSLARYLKGHNVFVNKESTAAQKYIVNGYGTYSQLGVGGWRASDINVGIEGTSFWLSKGKATLKLKSGLIGRHQVGVLSLAAVLGMELGLSKAEVILGVSKTLPFAHRMQPYKLSGAWIIDDTYNGNIEGVKAGLMLLGELKAKRKIYVTPGLVEQGSHTATVHMEMGHLISQAKPDIVVLMANSTTNYIKSGLISAGFKGELKIEEDPLAFYQNIEHFVANGDLVLMQNDWTDNYA